MKPDLKDVDAYSADEIRQKDYFRHLENEDCFEWFFHTDDSWIPDLEDYRRIVFINLVSAGPISILVSPS